MDKKVINSESFKSMSAQSVTVNSNSDVTAKLRVFSGEVKVKDKPWSAAKSFVHVCAFLDGSAEALHRLESIGWQSVKTLGAVIDPSTLAMTTHVILDSDKSLAQLAQEFYQLP